MNPTNAQISKYLFKMIEPGKCYHEFELEESDKNTEIYICKNCGQKDARHYGNNWESIYPENPDYFTEKGFFILWDYVIKMNFFEEMWEASPLNIYDFINYKTFPEQLARWIKEGR